MDTSPPAVGRTKKKRKKIRVPGHALTVTLPPPTAPAVKKSKMTKKKKVAEPINQMTQRSIA